MIAELPTLGKYRLLAEIGQGGMGSVYLAAARGLGPSLSKLVVVKRLRSYLATDAEFAAMFLDEARVAVRLNHPNVVQTIEAAQEGEELFLVMEYLDGQPLHRVLARASGDFPLEMHLAVLTDVLAGLHHAHELRDLDGTPMAIVHRDVTPQNVFITYDGQIKVVDFGIAHAEGRLTKTRPGLVKGKVAYMAPEQARAETVDRRADVFAVGVMLDEAITGRRFWGEERDGAIMKALVAGRVPPLAADVDIPPALRAIRDRALAATRDERYPTALAMQRDLESFAAAHLARPSASQIGAEVADLFAEHRKKAARVLEESLASLDAPREPVPATARAPEAPPPTVREPRGTPVTPTPTEPSAEQESGPRAKVDVAGRASVTDDAPTAVEPRKGRAPLASPPPVEPAPRPPKSELERDARARAPATSHASSKPRGAWTVVGVAVAIGVAAAALTHRDAPAGVRTIKVQISAEPTPARVRVDDGPWHDAPTELTVPSDDVVHRIQGEARGVVRDVRVRFDDDLRVRLVVER